jgi:LDH2 family malate/lactate/ureidoglycolate dehydrogenase
MLMDILGGVLSGAAFAGDVGDQYKNYERPQNVGHFFLALQPGLFVTADDFRARMDVLVQRVHGSPRAEGFDEILMPGEPEARQERHRLQHGIPYAESDLAPLLEIAGRLGVAPCRSRRRRSASRARPAAPAGPSSSATRPRRGRRRRSGW